MLPRGAFESHCSGCRTLTLVYGPMGDFAVATPMQNRCSLYDFSTAYASTQWSPMCRTEGPQKLWRCVLGFFGAHLGPTGNASLYCLHDEYRRQFFSAGRGIQLRRSVDRMAGRFTAPTFVPNA